jgi:hypothetical protein
VAAKVKVVRPMKPRKPVGNSPRSAKTKKLHGFGYVPLVPRGKLMENNDKPIYVRLRRLPEGQHVARTVDINNEGQVMVDLNANGEIIGVEILSYLDVEVDAKLVQL